MAMTPPPMKTTSPGWASSDRTSSEVIRCSALGIGRGRGFEPVRHTAMHHRHLETGAQMMPAGLWMRPAYYGPEAQREQAIREEATAVRQNVGLIDV